MASTFKIEDGDIVISSVSGRPIQITGPDKLRQDVVEFFEVDVQPNGFGAGLERLIGMLSFGGNAVFVSQVDRQIRDGIAELRELQRSDSRISRTSDERIVGATAIRVSQDSNDPTKYYYRVNIVTESGKTLALPSMIIGR